MKTPLMTPERLAQLVAGFESVRVAVVGDFFLDKYLDVDPAFEEVSVETGLPAHQVTSVRCYPGAAGTVVSNLAALGANKIFAIGFTGDDGEAFELRRALADRHCDCSHLHSSAERFTPTYLKPRDSAISGLSSEHSRYDTKNRQPLPPGVEQSIMSSLQQVVDSVDAVVVLDQVEDRNHGAITNSVRQHLIKLAAENSHLVFWADSRRRISEFFGLLTKPNQFETVGRIPVGEASVDREELRSAALKLNATTQAPVFVTLGADGIAVVDGECGEWTQIPTVTITGDVDPTGAGDSTTAGCILALCSGATTVEAAIIGNLVASITVEQLATTGTATSGELASRFRQWMCNNT